MCHSFSQLDLRADSAVASAADEVLRLTYAMIITHTHTQSHGHQGVKLMGVVHKRVKGQTSNKISKISKICIGLFSLAIKANKPKEFMQI